MITKDKYFIYDRAKKVNFKYIVKSILSPILGNIYKGLMKIYHPAHFKNKKYDVSICAIFKNEGKYLKEWIEYHKIVGVQHFYLYNNFSTDNYKEVLKPYVEEGLVTLTDWSIPQGQMKAYADCVAKYSKDTQWIGFIDLDEFVVPNKTDSIGEFLKKFINRPLVLIYWKMFGTSGIIHRDEKTLVTDSFRISYPKYVDIGKLFFNTDYEYADDFKKNEYMHYRWGRYGKVFFPPVNIFDRVCLFGMNPGAISDFPIQINHYVIKSYEEYAAKRIRGGGIHKDFHNEQYLWHHEQQCSSVDYHIFRFVLKLKLAMGMNKSGNSER